MTGASQEQRSIGSLRVSVAGLGCNNFGTRLDERGAAAVVHAAVDAGVTFFDTADYYGDGASEQMLGKALGACRRDVVIATKFGKYKPVAGLSGGEPRWIVRACDESLQRLGTDVIDLYLMHAPDPATPIGDTLAALDSLIRAGKVREIGCSNFSVGQLEEALTVATECGLPRFTCVQDEYSLLRRGAELELLPTCRRLGLEFIPYFPLASGMLTGKYRRGEPAPPGARLGDGRPIEESVETALVERTEMLRAFAEDRGHTLLELALSWLASRPCVASVIAGATTAAQVQENAAAVAAWPLEPEDLAELDRLSPPPA